MSHTRTAAFILGALIAAAALNAAASSTLTEPYCSHSFNPVSRQWRCGTPHIPRTKRNLSPPVNLNTVQASPPVIGDSREFLIYEGFHNGKTKTTATLRAEGPRCYIYVEDSEWNRGAVTEPHVQTLLNAFENETPNYPRRGIYDVVAADFGQPPDMDGNNRIILLILKTYGVGGYVWYGDENNADILYIGSDYHWGYDAIAAHEFQHLIHYRYDQREENWLNEGASELAEFRCGYAVHADSISEFEKYSRISLVKWPDLDSAHWEAHYGAAYLWTLYLYEQYGGIETVRDIVQSPLTGVSGVTKALQERGYGVSAADVFVDWRIALSADSASGAGVGAFSKYSFRNADVHFNAENSDSHDDYHQHPVPPQTRTIEAWAGHILEFKAPSPLQPSPLQFKMKLPDGNGGEFSAAAILYDRNGAALAARPVQKTSSFRVADLFSEMGTDAGRAEIVLAYHPPSEGGAEDMEYAYEAYREGAVDTPSVSAAVSGPSGVVKEDAFVVWIAFSEAVAGFTKSDLIVSNGVVVNFSGSGAAYTATIDPTSPGKVTALILESADGEYQDSNVYTVRYEPGGVSKPSVLRGFIGHAVSVAFSPDGRTLASGGNNKMVIVWDADTGGQMRTLVGHEHQINSVAYSPDGQTLASASHDNTIRLWDAGTGKQTRLIGPLSNYALSVTYSPDGQTLASGGYQDINIWNAETGALIRTIRNAGVSLAYSPDGQTLAGSGYQGIHIWNAETGALIRTLAGIPGWSRPLAYSPDGRTLASGSEDGTIHMWNAQTGALLRTLNGHTGAVMSLAYSPDGRALVSGSADHTVKVWDAKTGALTATLTDHADRIWSIAFSPDGQAFASGSFSEIRIWPFAPDFESLATVTITGPIGSVTGAFNITIAFSSPAAGFEASDIQVTNGVVTSLTGGGANYTATIEPSKRGKVEAYVLANADSNYEDSNVYSVGYALDGVGASRTLTGFIGHAVSVAYSPDGQTLASGGNNKMVIVWDADTGEQMRTLVGHEHQINSAAYSPDGQALASASHDNTIRLWDAAAGKQTRLIGPLSNYALSVTYSPDGRTLASGGYQDINIWDAKTGALIRTLRNSGVSLAYSPDGQTLAGSGNQAVRIWNAQTGALIRTLAGNPGWIYSAAYSPDGQIIASGSEDGTIHMWNAQTGALLRTLNGHTGAVMSLAYSPDGRALVSGSADHTVKVWDAKTGALTATLTDHADRIWSIAFSPDGQAFASGSFSEIRIWPFAPDFESLATVTITGPSGSVTGAFNITIAFSNPAAGFEASDIQVTNGVVTNLTGGGATYTATIEPSKRGKVEAYVLANADSNYEDSNVYSVGYMVDGVGAPRTLTGFIGYASSVAYSPDGQTLASGGNNKMVIVWDADTGEQMRTLVGHEHQINSVAYSPDGQTIASVSWDNTIRLWDAGTGKQTRMLGPLSNYTMSIVFSPDGQTLASAGYLEMNLWNAKTGALLRTLKNAGISLAYSPDGQTLASGGNQEVRIWNARTGALIRTLAANSGWTYSVAYSPDGQTIASGSGDGIIHMWNAKTGALLRTLAAHTDEVMSVAYSPDGMALVSGSSDHTVKVWNAKTGALTATLTDHTDRVMSIAFSPDGQAFASGSFSEIRIWPFAPDFESFATVTIAGPSGSVSGAFEIAIAFSEAVDGFEASDIQVTNGAVTSLTGGGAAYTATIKPSKPGGVAVKIPANAAGNNEASNEYAVDYEPPSLAHTGGILAAAYSPDGSAVATAAADDAVLIWDAELEIARLKLTGHTGDVRSAAFSTDGAMLATGSADHTIRVWNADTGAHVRTLEGHTDDVYAVDYSPDGSAIVSGSGDRTVRLWSAETGKLLKTMPQHSGPVRTAAFSPDGSLLASGSGDKTVRLWNAQTGKLLATMKEHARTIYSVAFSPDGKVLASGSADKTIRFWDVSSQSLIHTRTAGGSGGLLFSVAFSPDGSTLASGNQDGTVQLWASGNGRLLETLEGHTGTVYAVAYSPDSQTLISGSRDKTLRFWSLPSPQLDANGDGVVDIADLAHIAANYGSGGGSGADVNGDGVVDIADVLLVVDALAGQAGAVAAAPALASLRDAPSVPQVSAWLNDADRLLVRSDSAKRGIAVLEDMLRSPRQAASTSALLPNYPNPFNPETWIPFDLSEASRVKLTIYNAAGQTVRVLELGELPAGAYRSRAKAAHWDGRNALGEPAAAGIYFVRIEAGSFTALRRMVVLK